MRDAIPPPPPVAPVVTVNTVSHAAATLQSSARYLSGAARKPLLAQFKPLAQDSLPEPTNLLAWWQQVKSMVESLDISFMALSDPFRFTSSHV